MIDTRLWYVLINPYSGKGDAVKQWAVVSGRLQAQGYTFRLIEIKPDQSIAEEVRVAIGAGARRLIIVGGDGTHHHAINGIMTQETCSPEEVCYALLPTGTGNDWRREYGIPRKPEKWASMFLAQREARQDVGLIEAVDPSGAPVERYFANVAGLGYDAHVIRYLGDQGIDNGSGIQYFKAIYSCLRTYAPVSLRVETEIGLYEQEFYSLNFGIARYSGGGMRFVPHAVPDDGRFAFTFIPSIASWRVAINTLWLYTPFFASHPLTTTGHSTQVKIEHTQKPSWIEADGEMVGITPATLRVIPSQLRIICP